jgi:hypothetical protein
MQGKKKRVLTREAFIFAPDLDVYYCPMGRELPRLRKQTSANGRQLVEYQSTDCSSCPLASKCLSGQATARRITRDEYAPHREALSARMASEVGKALYQQRAPWSEGAFARIKQQLGIRQFLLRGLATVRCEWLWIATAYNLGKLLAFATTEELKSGFLADIAAVWVRVFAFQWTVIADPQIARGWAGNRTLQLAGSA